MADARDPTQFADGNLARFDALMFVSTSEEVLDGPQQGALERYLRAGGVYAGVHSASACLYNNSVYLQAVGGELRAQAGAGRVGHLPPRWR